MGLNIGVLIDRLIYGGAEKVAINEVKALREIGHNAVLIIMMRNTSNYDPAFAEILGDTPVMYLSDRLPRPFRFSFKFPFFSFFSLFHVTFPILAPIKVRKKEFDVIIGHGTYTCFTAVSLSKLRGIPLIAYIWDPVRYIIGRVYSSRLRFSFLLAFMQGIGKLLDRLIVKTSRFTVTASERHYAYLKILDNKRTKIRVFYPSVNVARTPNVQKQDYVLSVTAWKKGKEPELLFPIAKELKDLKFVIAGAWLLESYRKFFTDQVKSYGLEGQLIVTGALAEEKLVEFYRNALVFLQCRADVGFGIPALEAAANGCTFIIPEGQGVCGLFESGVDGFYFREGDSESVMRLITLLNKDKQLAAKMGLNAWTKVRQRYSWRRHVEELMKLISQLDLVSPEPLTS